MGYYTGIVSGHKLVLHVCVEKGVVQMLYQTFRLNAAFNSGLISDAACEQLDIKTEQLARNVYGRIYRSSFFRH